MGLFIQEGGQPYIVCLALDSKCRAQAQARGDAILAQAQPSNKINHIPATSHK